MSRRVLHIYPRGSDERLSEHFAAREFECRCGECPETAVDPELIAGLERLRALVSKPVTILSGYRCSDRQAKLRGDGLPTASGISTHEKGMAADVLISDLNGHEIERLARAAGFKAVGVASTWAHVDARSDGTRRWVYG